MATPGLDRPAAVGHEFADRLVDGVPDEVADRGAHPGTDAGRDGAAARPETGPEGRDPPEAFAGGPLAPGDGAALVLLIRTREVDTVYRKNINLDVLEGDS